MSNSIDQALAALLKTLNPSEWWVTRDLRYLDPLTEVDSVKRTVDRLKQEQNYQPENLQQLLSYSVERVQFILSQDFAAVITAYQQASDELSKKQKIYNIDQHHPNWAFRKLASANLKIAQENYNIALTNLDKRFQFFAYHIEQQECHPLARFLIISSIDYLPDSVRSYFSKDLQAVSHQLREGIWTLDEQAQQGQKIFDLEIKNLSISPSIFSKTFIVQAAMSHMANELPAVFQSYQKPGELSAQLYASIHHQTNLAEIDQVRLGIFKFFSQFFKGKPIPTGPFVWAKDVHPINPYLVIPNLGASYKLNSSVLSKFSETDIQNALTSDLSLHVEQHIPSQTRSILSQEIFKLRQLGNQYLQEHLMYQSYLDLDKNLPTYEKQMQESLKSLGLHGENLSSGEIRKHIRKQKKKSAEQLHKLQKALDKQNERFSTFLKQNNLYDTVQKVIQERLDLEQVYKTSKFYLPENNLTKLLQTHISQYEFANMLTKYCEFWAEELKRHDAIDDPFNHYREQLPKLEKGAEIYPKIAEQHLSKIEELKSDINIQRAQSYAQFVEFATENHLRKILYNYGSYYDHGNGSVMRTPSYTFYRSPLNSINIAGAHALSWQEPVAIWADLFSRNYKFINAQKTSAEMKKAALTQINTNDLPTSDAGKLSPSDFKTPPYLFFLEGHRTSTKNQTPSLSSDLNYLEAAGVLRKCDDLQLKAKPTPTLGLDSK